MEKFNINDFTPGDIVSIMGSNGNKTETWYGEVVDKVDNNTLLVCLLERTKEQGGKIWRFCGAETEAPIESIMQHVIPERPNNTLVRRTMKKAWKRIGFAVGVDDFVKREDELSVVLEMGNGDSSSDSSDSDFYPETEEESDDEEFTMASDTDEFTTETHKIVEDWNNWEPKTSQEKRFKSVIDRIEAREMAKADDRAFARGKPAPDFRRPMKKRRC